MARQRDYREEYRRRVEKARREGFSGYSEKRKGQDAELRLIMASDIFQGLPDEMQTEANARLYRKGFMYVGKPTKAQRKARDKLLAVTGDAFDTGAWAQFYKDILYPAATGKPYPNFQPIQTVDWEHMTPEQFDRLTGE